jgi:hypothetical protein
MFYTAKTFSVHRQVRNHYSKRILNLILNRKKFLRGENDTLGEKKRGKTRRGLAWPAWHNQSTLTIGNRPTSLYHCFSLWDPIEATILLAFIASP